MFLIPPPGLTKKKGPLLPEFIGVSAASAGDGPTSLQPGLPSYQEGDLLIFIAAVGSAGINITGTPSGYSLFASTSANLAGDGTSRMSCWYKVATASESNPTVNFTGGTGYKVASLFSFRNAKLTVPAAFISYVGQSNSFTSNTPMPGTQADGSIRLSAFYCNRVSTASLITGNPTFPGTITQRVSKQGGGGGDNANGDRGMYMYTGVRPTVTTGGIVISGFNSTTTGALNVEVAIDAP